MQQGFFPTPDRVVEWVAKMLTPEIIHGRYVSIVDAGCGEGKALHDLRNHMLALHPTASIKLFGVESDKHRAPIADALFKSGPGSGECLWCPIEDARPNTEGMIFGGAAFSMLWFNPPYDRIRGGGRVELDLFLQAREWTISEVGLMVMIVPDYVISDSSTSLAEQVERNFTVLRRLKFPDPEYNDFKQCVIIGKRREKKLSAYYVPFPAWAQHSENWPVMDGSPSPKELKVVCGIQDLSLHRIRLGIDIISDFVEKSPIRGQLLQSVMAEAPRIGRPPLPLSSGHLALALGGGLCDGIIENGPGDQFLIKGSLRCCTRKTGTKEKTNRDGDVIADIDVYRTRYEMVAKCLRSDGTIEEYSSADPDEELAGEDVLGNDDAEE